MSESISSLLESLRSTYESIGLQVSGSLSPPIPRAQLAKECSWFPHELPEEIIEMYGWRGGQEIDPEVPSACFRFRDVGFITPQKAKCEYDSMMATYGLHSTKEQDGVELSACFPFASFSGSWLVFPCGAQTIRPEHPRAVLNVFQGFYVLYWSVPAMLKTVIECALHPEFLQRNWRWQHIEEDILEKHNPGILGASSMFQGEG